MGKTSLLHPITAQLLMPKPSSPTPAGPSEDSHLTSEDKQALIGCINHVFGILRVNYHNQFLKAYPDLDTLNQGKRLWLKLLAGFSPERILFAVEQSMLHSDFLPGVSDIHKHLTESLPQTLGLVDARTAFIEACRAPAPKSGFAWSHPAVYWAGRATDWHFLASQPERRSFPIFESNYHKLCQRVANGDDLEKPIPLSIPENIDQPELPKAKKKAKLSALRKRMSL